MSTRKSKKKFLRSKPFGKGSKVGRNIAVGATAPTAGFLAQVGMNQIKTDSTDTKKIERVQTVRKFIGSGGVLTSILGEMFIENDFARAAAHGIGGAGGADLYNNAIPEETKKKLGLGATKSVDWRKAASRARKDSEEAFLHNQRAALEDEEGNLVELERIETELNSLSGASDLINNLM